MDGPGQLRHAAIHAVQQKLTHSGTVVRQKLTQRTMIGGIVRVVAPKQLRFGKKFPHIFDLVWSQLPVTEIVAGKFRTACIPQGHGLGDGLFTRLKTPLTWLV